MWRVILHPAGLAERDRLPLSERSALNAAIQKLQAMGPTLPYPHQSDVRGARGLRELRPRAGRSPWRAFYARVGDTFIVASIGPEAEVNPRGFDRAVHEALTRLANPDPEDVS